MDVFVAHEKHGTYVYQSALAIIRDRLSDGYWYEKEASEKAQKIISSQTEDAARAELMAERFLWSRNDYEYERIEKEPVIT